MTNSAPRERGHLVVGLDPGSRVAGWGAVADRNGTLEVAGHGAVQVPAGSGLAERLGLLFREVQGILDRFDPDEVAVESVFAARNARSALVLGQARGAVLAAVDRRPCAEYPARTVKQALTGFGGAGKDPVASMVARRLGLPGIPEPRDATDALAVAICHLDARRARLRLARARTPAVSAP